MPDVTPIEVSQEEYLHLANCYRELQTWVTGFVAERSALKAIQRVRDNMGFVGVVRPIPFDTQALRIACDIRGEYHELPNTFTKVTSPQKP